METTRVEGIGFRVGVFIGIMEKKMETTRVEGIGFRVGVL